MPGSPATRTSHKLGLRLLLDWLEDQPGQTWQDRWLASGAHTGDGSWRQVTALWLRGHGHQSKHRQEALTRAVTVAISADLIRPSLSWLVTAAFRRGSLAGAFAQSRDADGFARLQALCSADPGVSPAAANRTLYRGAQIAAAKGGTLSDITTGDLLELLEAEADVHGTSVGATHLFYRVLHAMGVFGAGAPATLRELRSTGQRTPGEMIDRYGLACRPVRDLLVDYLRERQPALDYTSLETLANFLGRLFWADLERHHPGIDNLRLPAKVAAGWKQRLRTMTKTTPAPGGRQAETTAPRINYRECLTPVRAFYLDLAHWAVDDPARWGPWVAPCPVGSEEVSRRKAKRLRKSRMDARTRERLPVLPVLVRTVDQRRRAAAVLLDAARQARPGQAFTADGQTLIRSSTPRSASARIWVDDPGSGKRRDLGREEEHAFWAFAAVEILRATGIRVEELTELSHHSLVQYRLPTTGEVVPLLQIAPSKTDTERLLLVSPELADVLSAIISRVRDHTGAVPLVPAYDGRERTWSPPAPLLFQRHYPCQRRGALGLSSYSAHPRHLGGVWEGGGLGPPVRQLYYSGFHKFQAVEESGDLLRAAEMVWVVGGLVIVPYGLVERLAGVDTVVEGEVAAGRHGIQQPLDDRLRAVGVGDLAQDPEHHDRDRLGEVERLGRSRENLVRLTHVGVDVVAGALGSAGEQGAGVHQHERVVVHVDDARFRSQPLGDLVCVVGGRQTGADVQELADPCLADQIPDRAQQKRPGTAGRAGHVRERRDDPVTSLAVDGIVVLATQPVVPDPGRMRHACVDLRPFLAGGGRTVGHGTLLHSCFDRGI
jgi:hypothetical protein